MGYLLHGNGDPFPGRTVGVWSDAWQGAVSGPSELDGKYAVDLSNVPAGSYQVAVVDPGTCSSRGDGQLAANGCRRLSNVVAVTIFEIWDCEKSGTVQWAEVHFRGP